jgi:hypothetical protein
MDLDTMLALMAAPIYARMRSEFSLVEDKRAEKMIIAVEEATLLWQAVIARTEVS